jgi:ribonuclease VapC
MSKVYVLDTYAVLCFLEDEPGSHLIAEIIMQPKALLYMSVVNLGEVYYIITRRRSRLQAEKVKQAILDTESITLVNIDLKRALLAAAIKAEKKISYADCFTIALAKEKNATIITGDQEFAQVADEVAIEWLPTKKA